MAIYDVHVCDMPIKRKANPTKQKTSRTSKKDINLRNPFFIFNFSHHHPATSAS
jgi:hypothetical protein